MNDFEAIEGYRKVLIIIMAVMVLLFAVIYVITIKKTGYEYRESLLSKTEENGIIEYSGKVEGKDTVITVNAESIVVKVRQREYGSTERTEEKVFGPYTVKEDPSMVSGSNRSNDATGYEIKKKDKVLFRGILEKNGDTYLFFSEDGEFMGFGGITVTSNGIRTDMYGNKEDSDAPSISELMLIHWGLDKTHKGNAAIWFLGTFICIVNALMLILAEQLYRFYMRFRMSNPEDAIPSDWELFSRVLGAMILIVVALVIYIMGLK